MAAEHMRPMGLSQGYYCQRCGSSCNMYASGHQDCTPNPELVYVLKELNHHDNSYEPKHRR